VRSWIIPFAVIAITGCGAHQRQPPTPVSFVANHGQFDARVKYEARGSGYELAAQDGGIVLALN